MARSFIPQLYAVGDAVGTVRAIGVGVRLDVGVDMGNGSCLFYSFRLFF